MWSNEISIDKKYTREIEYILSKLEKMKDLSFAVEESQDRVWIYLASACEKQDALEDEIGKIVETVILTFMKIRYFLEKLDATPMNYAKCVLICSLVHFDKDFERTVVQKVLSSALDYNLDGLMNFRLRALKDEWQELAVVSNRLLAGADGEDDVYEVSAFITGNDQKKSRIVITGDSIKNLTEHKTIEVLDVFDNDEFNLINSLVENHPAEIVLENFKLSRTLQAPLRKIARVIENN